MEKGKYPSYWDVDDVLVKIDHDASTDEVFAMTAGGKEYPIAKARFEGSPITEKEFNDRVKQIQSPSSEAAAL